MKNENGTKRLIILIESFLAFDDHDEMDLFTYSNDDVRMAYPHILNKYANLQFKEQHI